MCLDHLEDALGLRGSLGGLRHHLVGRDHYTRGARKPFFVG